MPISKSRLREYYENHIVPTLQKEGNYDNKYMVPKLVKIVVSLSDKEATTNSKIMDSALQELYLITGQKPVLRKARKAIATFGLREGTPIGVMVTLRRDIMYHFLDKLLNIALPRSRDFRGLSTKKFDGRGNYAMGIKEHIIFPEIDYDKIDKIRGFNIVFVTSAKTNEEALALLKYFNFPFMS